MSTPCLQTTQIEPHNVKLQHGRQRIKFCPRGKHSLYFNIKCFDRNENVPQLLRQVRRKMAPKVLRQKRPKTPFRIVATNYSHRNHILGRLTKGKS